MIKNFNLDSSLPIIGDIINRNECFNNISEATSAVTAALGTSSLGSVKIENGERVVANTTANYVTVPFSLENGKATIIPHGAIVALRVDATATWTTGAYNHVKATADGKLTAVSGAVEGALAVEPLSGVITGFYTNSEGVTTEENCVVLRFL